MRVLKQTDRYVILDDVLPPEQFALMLANAARSGRGLLPRREGRHAVVAVTMPPCR